MNIRRATGADAPVLTRIAHAAKRHWGYGDDLIALWTADLTVTPPVIEADPVYCAVLGSDIVGFYALSREGAVIELEHMWVDPGSMGTGVGARLFAHALEMARALGGRTLEIASDPNAEGFYLRMGARRVGSVPSKPAGRELSLLVVDLG